MERQDPKTEIPEVLNDEDLFRKYLLDPANFPDEEEHIATLDVCLDREYRKSRFGDATAREIVIQLHQIGEFNPGNCDFIYRQPIKTEFGPPLFSVMNKPKPVLKDPFDPSLFTPNRPLVPPAPVRVSAATPSSSAASIFALALAVSTAVYSAYQFGKKSPSDSEAFDAPSAPHSVVNLQELPPPKTICAEPEKPLSQKKVQVPEPQGTVYKTKPIPQFQSETRQPQSYPSVPSPTYSKNSDVDLSKKSRTEIDDEISELEYQRRYEIELSVPRVSRGSEYESYKNEVQKRDDRYKRLQILKDYRKRRYGERDND